MPNIYIYCRVSTEEQSTDQQADELLRIYPSAEVHCETESGVKKKPVLQALLGKLQTGDTLAVYSLDRLGRLAKELVPLMHDFTARGIIFFSKREGLDISTPVGRCMATMFAAIAEFEREIISERNKSKAKALKRRGLRAGGRYPPVAKAVEEGALRDVFKGILRVKDVAAKHGISVRHLYRVLAKRRDSVAPH